jgi:hypothetical protein
VKAASKKVREIETYFKVRIHAAMRSPISPIEGRKEKLEFTDI